jgi:hypothetical protein
LIAVRIRVEMNVRGALALGILQHGVEERGRA